jgi:hypothetical protein
VKARPVQRVDNARKPGHVHERHGTAPRRSPALRVFDDLSLPESWEMLPGVPATRGDCPTTRPCPHVKCRYHLWLVEGEAMPGRRWETAMPASSFHPWSNTTCALDVAEQGSADPDVVAHALGVSERQVRRIVEAARRKLAANPDAAEVLAAIGEGPVDSFMHGKGKR